MKKKTKICFCALTAVASVGVISAVALTSNNNLSPSKANDDPHIFTLNASNGITSEEQKAGKFTRENSVKYPIDFAHSGAESWSSGVFQVRGQGKGIWNTVAITGLKSIKVKADESSVEKPKKYSILFGNKAGEYIYSSEVITGTGNVQEYVVPQYETPFSFFRLQSETDQWMHFTSVEIAYSCSAELAARGQEYTPTSGNEYDFDTPVPVAEGSVINVDVKRTDPGTENGKISMCLFQDWNTSFGYKTLNINTKTGDVPGLTVTHLSDGYIRYSWKLSEMTGGTPTTIAFVHIDKRDGWTTSSGYFDVDSTASVVEYKGKRFTAAAGLDVTLDTPVSATTGKIQIDFYYTTVGKVSFAICDNDSVYYGYFDMKQLGNNASVYGLEVVSQTNGFVRFTAEGSKITRKTGDPANMNKITIHKGDGQGGWTTADGYIDVTVLAE